MQNVAESRSESNPPQNCARSRRDPADHRRAQPHADKIPSMLTAAGSVGCTNLELWSACHPVNSRISDLRARGHRIKAKPEGRGAWRYWLIPLAEPAPREPAAPAVDSGDWYTRATGEPRPSLDREDLFLFNIAESRS